MGSEQPKIATHVDDGSDQLKLPFTPLSNNLSFDNFYRDRLQTEQNEAFALSKDQLKKQFANVKASKNIFHSDNKQLPFANTSQQNNQNDKCGDKSCKEKCSQGLYPITFSTFCSVQDMQLQQQGQKQNIQSLLYISNKKQTQKQEKNNKCNEVICNLVDVNQKTMIEIHKEQFIRIRKFNIDHDYIIHQKIGEGAFGEVYRCEHILTRQIRAVKVLKRNILINPKVKEQFMQEFNILKKVDHPNIIKIYQIYQKKYTMHIVSQFCSGGTLHSYIKDHFKFSPAIIKQILHQIFRAVNYLHSVHVVHRDIKPENIVFTSKIQEDTEPSEIDLRIIDFGLSVEKSDKTFKDWNKIGTLNYMAPESFNGIYSIKTDSWSCGLIMFILIVGYNPYKSQTINEDKLNPLQLKAYHSDPKWREIDSQTASLIQSLLQNNYYLRMSLNEALNHSFFHCQDRKKLDYDKNKLISQIISCYSYSDLINIAESYWSLMHLSQEEQRKLARIFAQIDKDQNGLISLEQFKECFASSKLTERTLAFLFKRIDKSKTNSISFSQFSSVLGSKSKIFEDHYIEELFKFIDLNRNNSIERDELKHFLKSLDKNQVEKMIKAMNKDETGKLKFQEFKAYLQLHF